MTSIEPNAEFIDEAIALLDEAQQILIADAPDMDVVEYGATPPGRALRCIQSAIATLLGGEDD
jgi:hypothetical protein